MDHYIGRIEMLVRKMGILAPSDSTQKRNFIDGLRDPNAQKFVSLHKPIDLAMAKQEAPNGEEVKMSQTSNTS